MLIFDLGLPVDKHVHVLSIFVKKKKKKTIPLYCFDERKLQNSEGKGKMLSKVSLHMYCP